MITPPGLLPQAAGVDWFDSFKVRKPVFVPDENMDRLTREIDWLERQIETYGSVVPKQPDIWGEARLTRHRHEYDVQMSDELGGFTETLNASIRQSDQAITQLAIALGAGEEGSVPNPLDDGEDEDVFTLLPKPTPENPNPHFIQGKTDSSLGFDSSNLSLEPVTKLSQKSRYLYYLNELRRTNEGDDTADSPGYSMYLARIPVSVLPGKHTRRGYGAEITFTAEPYLSEALLPEVFRVWVINDILNQSALPLLKIIEDPRALEAAKSFSKPRKQYRVGSREDQEEVLNELRDEVMQKQRQKTIESLKSQSPERDQAEIEALADVEIAKDDLADHITMENAQEKITSRIQQKERANLELQAQAFQPVEETVSQAVNLNVSTAVWKDTRLAFPPSQQVDIYGRTAFGVVATHAYDSLRDRVGSRCIHAADVRAFLRPELEAAYQFLQQPELQSLWQHCSPLLVEAIRQRRRWLPDSEYNAVIKDGHGATLGIQEPIFKLRSQFYSCANSLAPRAAYSTTLSLAWEIIVHSALLNERLISEMSETAIEKGCGCGMEPGTWLDFYMPNPSPDARAMFNEFVACRWPMHIFTIDPITDEQNVAEVFSRRREMQLAISVAVANGEMRAGAGLRFMRQLETDIEAITLNRTTVGFVHGERTFGWRFYPRVQPPKVSNNLVAFGETLFGGPNENHDMRDRKLEPGMRECIAVIVMPSFVPYVTFNSRANWFGLTNPRKKEWTVHETLMIGQAYQSILATLGCAGPGAACYRPIDVASLHEILKQMENRLPIQTKIAQFPFEGSLGGIEILNDGSSSLGPKLYGWYGCPGVLCAKGSTCHCEKDGFKFTGKDQCADTCGGTTLFLQGDNFSVHDTRVVAGGRCVPFELMSRQVMRVTIPHKVNTVKAEGCCGTYAAVEVNVATPYGVSDYMRIPVVDKSCTGESGENPCPANEDTATPAGDSATSAAAAVQPASGISWDEEKLAKAVVSVFPYKDPKKWQKQLGCMDVVFHHCPELKPTDMAIIQSTTNFPLPAASPARIVVSLTVQNSGEENPRKVEKSTKQLLLVHDPANNVYMLPQKKLRRAIEAALEDKSGEGLLVTDNPTEIIGTTQLQLNGFPTLQLDNELKIEVTQVSPPVIVPPVNKPKLNSPTAEEMPVPGAGSTSRNSPTPVREGSIVFRNVHQER